MSRNALFKWLRGFNPIKISSVLLFTVLLSVSTILTGCGGSETTPPPEANTPTEAPAPSETPKEGEAKEEEAKEEEAKEEETKEEETKEEASDSINDQFLGTLKDLIDKQGDEKLTALAQELTEQDAINDANMFCQELDKGTAINDILQSVQDDADNKELTEEQQGTLGTYLGFIMVTGTKYYCPRHQETVDKWASS